MVHLGKSVANDSNLIAEKESDSGFGLGLRLGLGLGSAKNLIKEKKEPSKVHANGDVCREKCIRGLQLGLGLG